jgi:hypothetical protein
VARDRVLSVVDSEMRHGHKSAHYRFNERKAQVVVDTESQLITAVEVLPGKAPDHDQALAMVQANMGLEVADRSGTSPMATVRRGACSWTPVARWSP